MMLSNLQTTRLLAHGRSCAKAPGASVANSRAHPQTLKAQPHVQPFRFAAPFTAVRNQGVELFPPCGLPYAARRTAVVFQPLHLRARVSATSQSTVVIPGLDSMYACFAGSTMQLASVKKRGQTHRGQYGS